ncbi:MAG: hypothetical protein ABI700_07235 [Chloroflexota bacterium]
MKKIMILMTALLALLAVSVPLTSAQDCPTTGTPVTKTLTEAQINSSFRVTNPANRNVSNVNVDLQPGQVVISETYTWRSATGVRTDTVVAILTPAIVNGRVEWNVLSVTANGQPASAELIAQINASLATSWRRWFAENGPTGRVSDVTVSDDAISYTYIAWAVGCVPPPSVTGTDEPRSPVTLTYTETQINSTFRVTNPATRSVTDEYVNLQPNQVTITATLTWRQRGSGIQTASVAVTLTPSVSNGQVDWNVVSITANGQAASAELVTQINASLAASWHRWVADNAPAGVITAITITEDDISYSYIPRQ